MPELCREKLEGKFHMQIIKCAIFQRRKDTIEIMLRHLCEEL
jgi:hypothetical protein